MNMDEVLQVFIAESQELLQQMEEALLQLENDPDDADTINAVFRAAHTIKGSAGLFGLDVIVAFTHIAESVLDRVRNGELRFDKDMTALFLQVGDHLARLVALVDSGADLETLEEDTQIVHQQLAEQLSRYLDPAPASEPMPATATRIERGHGEGVGADHWHLSLRFGPDTLRNGMDPLGLFRYLSTFGKIASIVPLLDRIPVAAEMDPETCYLGFEMAFVSDADKATIEGAFEFVREDSLIRILPPNSRSDQYLELIRALPEEDMRLGEILMRCGTLTANELQEVLQAQVQGQERDEPRPIGRVLVEESLVQPPVIAAALQKQQQIKENRSNENSLIRVDAGKLDKLIDLVGELIIAGAGARMTAQNCGHPEMLEATELLSRLVEEVRDSALPLRMVQIGSTFNRFQRVVRDVAGEIGKDIALSISGGETELDKTVVERITDPLTHLVRNAMDHGIESVETRLARGKPAQGKVSLNAYHDAGSIVLEVSDDGGGLDAQRILAKARERGLIGEGQTLSDTATAQGDVAATQTWDYPELMVGSDGLLPNDRKHQLKAYGFVDVTKEVVVGANLLLASGRPRSCSGTNPITNAPGWDGENYQSAARYCFGATGDQNVLVPRGTLGRLPWEKTLDLNVVYRPAMLEGLALRVDVYNVFNDQSIQKVNERYNTNNSRYALYETPTYFTAPRAAKFSVEYNKRFN